MEKRNERDLPESFWGDAISTANYMQNRILTRSTNKTLYEFWYGEKPDVSVFHVFLNIPSQKRRKLDVTAVEMIFIAYDANTKAYCCYDASYTEIVISRDTRFKKMESSEILLDQEYKCNTSIITSVVTSLTILSLVVILLAVVVLGLFL